MTAIAARRTRSAIARPADRRHAHGGVARIAALLRRHGASSSRSITDTFLTAGQPPQHPAPDRAAADRRGRDDLRHHHRRHRPLGRLGAGARQRAGGDLAAGRRPLAARRRADAAASASPSAPFQGFFIAYEGIPAFIVTLAGLSAIRGIALLLTKGYSIPIDPESPFNEIGRGWIFGLPMPALIAVVVARRRLSSSSTRRTFGRYVTGIGANAEAVRRAGVNTRRVTLSVYVHQRHSRRRSPASSSPRGSAPARPMPASASSSTSSPPSCSAAPACSAAAARCVGTMLGALTVAVIGNGLILCAPVAVPHADRHRRHHPGRDLAQFPPVPRGPAEAG